jgi:hypothetical protein
LFRLSMVLGLPPRICASFLIADIRKDVQVTRLIIKLL